MAQSAAELGRTHKGFLKETAVRAKAELADRVDEILRGRGRVGFSHPVKQFYLKTRYWSWVEAANFWMTHNVNGRLPNLCSRADFKACGIPWTGLKRGGAVLAGKPTPPALLLLLLLLFI